MIIVLERLNEQVIYAYNNILCCVTVTQVMCQSLFTEEQEVWQNELEQYQLCYVSLHCSELEQHQLVEIIEKYHFDFGKKMDPAMLDHILTPENKFKFQPFLNH